MSKSPSSPNPTSLLPYSFLHTDNMVVNMHELIAVGTEGESDRAVLVFKDGHKLYVTEAAKAELINAIKVS